MAIGRVAIRTARNAADLLGPQLADARCERLLVLHLDRQGNRIALDEFEGGPNTIDLPIRDICRAALRRDAFGLVIAHNHPGGDPQPSAADIAATRRLAAAAAALDIRLHDHLVFAGGACRSFRELGLI